MAKRTKYLIDKGFQLRTAFSIIGVVAAVSLIILSAIAASVVYNNEKINNIYQIEDNIFQGMQTASINGQPDEDYRSTVEMLTRIHDNNLNNITKLAEYNRYLLVALILCVIFQGFILFIMIIRITHRISGPIYVMSNYIKEIINGEMPDPRPLRDKDELKKFYNLFVDLVESIKEKHK
jgi:nitrate/nitrite-specific signal transduction histidine kinase